MNKNALRIALEELLSNIHELPDPQEHPRIVEYLSGVGMAPDDEISWCAAFVNWCLEKSGFVGTKKAAARSYMNWGRSALPNELGAVVVLWRGSPTSWQGHVAFLLDTSPDGVYLIGGNQSNRVSVAKFPKNRILGYRLPRVEDRRT